MLKGLYIEYLSPTTNLLNKTFHIKEGESARGIRFILHNFTDISSLKFRSVIKINEELYDITDIYTNFDAGYVDVILPCLAKGIYLSEFAVIEGERKLLSGIFKLEYTESLTSSTFHNLNKINGDDVLEKLLNSEKKLDEIIKKTDNLTGFVDKNYIHEQMSSSQVWDIEHNLNKYPSVSIIDSGGNEVLGDINYTSKNHITIKFSSAFSGSAFLN